VVDAIDYAQAEGLRVAAQRTGHSAEPLGDLADSLLIRTAALSRASIDAERRVARVGSGALWGDLVPQASELGLAACHGSSPAIGIAGYSLGGGVGWCARKHGLQCNRVTAIELVDATATERRVDAAGDAELFWALRGAGGDFGVVTAIEFELLPITEVFAGALFFPLSLAPEVLHTWHQFIRTAPDEVTSVARVMNLPATPEMPEAMRGRSFAIVEAVALLPEPEAVELLAPLRGLSGAIMDTFATVPPAGTAASTWTRPSPPPTRAGGCCWASCRRPGSTRSSAPSAPTRGPRSSRSSSATTAARCAAAAPRMGRWTRSPASSSSSASTSRRPRRR
jgi:FAD/FMN-containing dehydrogenase